MPMATVFTNQNNNIFRFGINEMESKFFFSYFISFYLFYLNGLSPSVPCTHALHETAKKKNRNIKIKEKNVVAWGMNVYVNDISQCQ